MSLADQLRGPASVQVSVQQARGLRIKGKAGTNDAYAVMQVGKEKFQTSVAEKSVAPVWGEEAAFDLPPGGGGGGKERSTLHVHVLHRALVGPDKLLGQAVVDLPQLSEDKSRSKTEWFKLLDKSGKADKDRGEVLLDIRFMRNNMTSSMFDLSAGTKSRSRLGKFKDKVRGKKRDSDTVSNVPSFNQVLTESDEEEEGGGEATAGNGEKKKLKTKSLFSSKSNLQRNLSQSMTVLTAKALTQSGSQSSVPNVDSSEGKKKFKFPIHKRSNSSDGKGASAGHQKPGAAEQSNVCINGSHVYRDEPPARASRSGSSFSLTSSGHGSMEDVPESFPQSIDSLRAMRQCSPWMEEEEEEEQQEEQKLENTKDNVGEIRSEAEEKIRMEEMKREEVERVGRKELERLADEKTRREEDERRTDEVNRDEEEKIRWEEEEMMRQEEEERHKREQEECERLDEQKRCIEEERVLKEKMEEEEMLRRQEERRLAEQESRRKEEEERFRMEEERVQKEMMRRQAEERLRRQEEEEERLRRQKEEDERVKRQMEEEERVKRQMEEEERVKRQMEEEERVKRQMEEEERVKRQMEEEERVKRQMEEEERVKRQMEEEERVKRQMEEEERVKRQKEEEERVKRQMEEEERVKRQMEEEERVKRQKEEEEQVKRQKEEEEQVKRQKEEEEQVKRQKEEEEQVRKLKERECKIIEEKRMMKERITKVVKIAEEERIRRDKEIEEGKHKEKELEERMEKARREKEEHGRLVEEKRRLEEEEKRRLEAEEKVRHEEEERIRVEEERKVEKEQKLAEEKRILEEQERRIQSERKQREEEEMIAQEASARKEKEEHERLVAQKMRQQEQERRKIEEEKIKEEERIRREMKEMSVREAQKNNTKTKAAEKKPTAAHERLEVSSNNPFDDNFSNNPFEELPDSPAGPDGGAAKVSTVQQRLQFTASSVGSEPVSSDDKDPINTQRERRAAPQPPGRNQAERPSRWESAESEQMNKKSKDLRTVSVLPQRSLQTAAPRSKSRAEQKEKSPQGGAAKETSDAAKPNKRTAPPIPRPPAAGGPPSEQKTHAAGSGLNPFEEDEDEAPDDGDAGSVGWPPVALLAADSDAASQTKVKSSKARAPPLPATTAATSSAPVGPDAGGGRAAGITGGADGPAAGAGSPVRPEEAPLQEDAGGKKAVAPVASRRLQPVKPLNPLEQQSASVVQGVNGAGVKGPYSQLTRGELVSLVLKQEKQLSERDKTISDLEQYIDNLLVRVIEEKPSILLSLNSLKRAT
ncbi:golgin subfamily A member 6-like protein 25 [Pungitius pungitius]|uniref:golgin subfamily A member 6-like protein 25 n=1 Tax=Pungitius pungitius TaxID=134920 RepID=UPI002E0D946A